MKILRPDELPQLTKIMYESQQRLDKKNWEDTLKANYKEVEKLLGMVSVFDIWKNALESKHEDIARDLIRETFLDSYMSIYFACMALYKQAHVSLRAELETTLRLVYFSSHPVEFKWWKDDKDYFKGKHIWGENYDYFTRLEEVQSFNDKAGIRLFDQHIRGVYKTLSKYVHGNFPSFQTTIQSVAPAYKAGEYKKWVSRFKEVQRYVNTVLALGFADDFKTIGIAKQRKVLKAIESPSYKKGIKQGLGLKIKGRV